MVLDQPSAVRVLQDLKGTKASTAAACVIEMEAEDCYDDKRGPTQKKRLLLLCLSYTKPFIYTRVSLCDYGCIQIHFIPFPILLIRTGFVTAPQNPSQGMGQGHGTFR
jgi:hypothetical protein